MKIIINTTNLVMGGALQVSEQVCFYGACYEEKRLGPLIAMADICVSPGEVGLTCIHSLSYGTPVITHDNPNYQMPEYEAITEWKTGAFFKYDDVVDLAVVIKSWLVLNKSRQAIRSDCYEIIDKYYNPYYRQKFINAAVLGVPADSDQLGAE